MRTLLILAALGYAGYSYFTGTLTIPFINSNADTPVISNEHGFITITHSNTPVSTRSHTPSASATFRCDGRQHCSQMRSYEEAVFFLRNCPNTKMDGDGDGIPCEQQFGR